MELNRTLKFNSVKSSLGLTSDGILMKFYLLEQQQKEIISMLFNFNLFFQLFLNATTDKCTIGRLKEYFPITSD